MKRKVDQLEVIEVEGRVRPTKAPGRGRRLMSEMEYDLPGTGAGCVFVALKPEGTRTRVV